jgi:hypothetical protein
MTARAKHRAQPHLGRRETLIQSATTPGLGESAAYQQIMETRELIDFRSRGWCDHGESYATMENRDVPPRPLFELHQQPSAKL